MFHLLLSEYNRFQTYGQVKFLHRTERECLVLVRKNELFLFDLIGKISSSHKKCKYTEVKLKTESSVSLFSLPERIFW